MIEKFTFSSRFPLAIGTILLAIFLFDVQGVMIKHMGSRYPVEQIAFFRNLFGLLPSLLVLYLSREWRDREMRWRISPWTLALGRGLMLIVAQMCLYHALANMQLATATTLVFAGPFFVTLLSIPLLGHRVGWWRSMAVALGFLGVILIMRPGSDAFAMVALLPITAALFYALSSLSSRFFDKTVPTALISIYSSMAAMFAAALLIVLLDRAVVMNSWQDWLWFVSMGTCGGFAVLLLITAYRMADPSSLSPFEYFGIPFSFALGWIFFREAPFESLFPGVLLIVGGGLMVIWRERTLKQLPS
ncbi:MAG: DMT family transporter [Granulosicoccus sp.]|nr:DMT family transporter [Granulosicoccus sp.]